MPSEQFTIGGVFCGKEIGNGLYAEELIQDRFVIRKRLQGDGVKRLGEVSGSNKVFLASRPNGDQVAKCSSFIQAARALTRI